MLGQDVFMGGEGRHAHAVHPIERRAEGNPTADVGRAGLELVGKFVVSRAILKAHGANHFASAAPRGHGVEKSLLAVQDADARRPVRLVAAKRVEVDVELLDVDREVWHRLRAVHQHGGAGVVGPVGPVLHVVDRAEGVGHVREGDELGRAGEVLLELVVVERAVRIELHHVDVKPTF